MLVSAVALLWGAVLSGWHSEALCQGANTALFYPDTVSQVAIKICERCSVRDACLEYALENDEPGIWGGTTEGQRRHMKNGTQRRRPGPKPRVATGIDNN